MNLRGFFAGERHHLLATMSMSISKKSSIEVGAKDLMNDADLSQNVKLKSGDYVVVI
jgi:hypothetical protein